jgi:succinate dehydrogenase/fumarate reductase cytochrome b subunit
VKFFSFRNSLPPWWHSFVDVVLVVSVFCSTVVGIGFPVYSTHKAIESQNHVEQEEWLVYWAGMCREVPFGP